MYQILRDYVPLVGIRKGKLRHAHLSCYGLPLESAPGWLPYDTITTRPPCLLKSLEWGAEGRRERSKGVKGMSEKEALMVQGEDEKTGNGKAMWYRIRNQY